MQKSAYLDKVSEVSFHGKEKEKYFEHLEGNNGRYQICGKENGSKIIVELHKEKYPNNKENFVFSESLLAEWDPEVAGGNH